jgi:hypothetical protein
VHELLDRWRLGKEVADSDASLCRLRACEGDGDASSCHRIDADHDECTVLGD